MKKWEDRLKEKTNSLLEKFKLSLMDFSDRSLWNKLFIMAFIHYTLRFILGGKSKKDD